MKKIIIMILIFIFTTPVYALSDDAVFFIPMNNNARDEETVGAGQNWNSSNYSCNSLFIDTDNGTFCESGTSVDRDLFSTLKKFNDKYHLDDAKVYCFKYANNSLNVDLVAHNLCEKYDDYPNYYDTESGYMCMDNYPTFAHLCKASGTNVYGYIIGSYDEYGAYTCPNNVVSYGSTPAPVQPPAPVPQAQTNVCEYQAYNDFRDFFDAKVLVPLRIAAVIIFLILTTVDYAKVIFDKEASPKKANTRLFKRLIALLLIFFANEIVTFITGILGMNCS